MENLITVKSGKIYHAPESERKTFEINTNNLVFFNEFKNRFSESPMSWLQYKVDCGAFLQSLNQKLLTSIEVSDIENYVNSHADNDKTKNNKRAHIRSLLIFCVKNDVRGAKSKLNREVLVYLIG